MRKDDVVLVGCGLEVRLSDIATCRVGTAGDDEEIVNSAIRGSVRITDEAGLSDRAVRCDEPGNSVGRAIC